MQYPFVILSLLLVASGIYTQEKEPDKPKDARAEFFVRLFKGKFGNGKEPSFSQQGAAAAQPQEEERQGAAAAVVDEPVAVCSACSRPKPQEYEKAHWLYESRCLACGRLNYNDPRSHPIYGVPPPEPKESTPPK